MATASPFMRSVDLERHGLEWLWPQIDMAHPLDDGSAGFMSRSIEATAQGLGRDGAAWKRLFAGPSAHFDSLLPDLMQPMLHLPRHPIRLTRFGIPALAPATTIARAFESEQAKAVFGGVAAHAISPLTKPLSASVGMALICSAHAFGWPVAKGGSRSITDALAAELVEHGGKVETGRRVESLDELPSGDVVLLDLSPARAPTSPGRGSTPESRAPTAATGTGLAPSRSTSRSRAECRGPQKPAGAPEPCTSPARSTRPSAPRRAVNAGRMPERPFVLVGQQYLADPSRSAGDVHPVWAYAHVPNGWERDETEAVIGQIERFAPGFRERIVAQVSKGPAEFESYNSNFIGGDIIGGRQLPAADRRRGRASGSGLTPRASRACSCARRPPRPAPGVHGMNGSNAAKAALAGLELASGRGSARTRTPRLHPAREPKRRPASSARGWFPGCRRKFLIGAGLEVFVSGGFSKLLDKRELGAGQPGYGQDLEPGEKEPPSPPFTDASYRDEEGALWLDYAADVGEGFDPTYTVAWLLGREDAGAGVGRRELARRRGRALVLGGDQVYPSASWEAYRDRFVGPYRAALPHLPRARCRTCSRFRATTTGTTA